MLTNKEVDNTRLSDREKEMLIELICNEQTIHMIAKGEYDSVRYGSLERLKSKIRAL